MLKEYRESSYREEEVKEIPFFQDVTNKVDEVHPFMEKKEGRIAPREELSETLRKIRSEANSKLSQLRTEDIANTKKDSHYFVSKYTSEKNILVDTIFRFRLNLSFSSNQSDLKPASHCWVMVAPIVPSPLARTLSFPLRSVVVVKES